MQALNAPGPLQGIAAPRGGDSADYVVDVVLSANEQRQVTIDIDPASNFFARAVLVPAQTGSFKFRWADSQQYWSSNARVDSRAYSSDPAAPTPIFPEMPIPANGRILLDLEDTSAAGNSIQLVFRGAKQFLRRG